MIFFLTPPVTNLQNEHFISDPKKVSAGLYLFNFSQNDQLP